MKYNAILFDLDGTLFPISNAKFEKVYLHSLAEKLSKYLDPKLMLQSMWEALEVMIKDDSDRFNDAIFYEEFGERVGHDLVKELQPKFDEYYANDFAVLKDHLDENHMIVEAIKLLKEKGYKLVIATNPMFPQDAVEQRILFSGLRVDDFDYVSNFSKHRRTKPNPEFYAEVCEAIGVDPSTCLMVGNDMKEDMAAMDLGMDGWILTDYLIEAEDVVADWSGTRLEFLEKVKEELL